MPQRSLIRPVFRPIALSALLAVAASAAHAQATSSVTLYGSVDQYLNYLTSSSGAKLKTLQDGAFVRSRVGFKGEEDLGEGLKARFNLETGLSADTGAQGDTTRFFDRQAWVSLAGATWGEVRLGRQNSVIQARGDAIDFTSRNLGSVVKAFGEPSRYDNDVSWLSPRLAGVQAEAHYALAETTLGMGSQAIYQLAVDYTDGPWRAGYGGIRGKAPSNATVKTTIGYDNLYANYNYGPGKVYLAYVRSNNSTSSSAGNNATNLLGGTGALVAGTSTDASRYYNIWQASADYNLNAQWRVGALLGRILDTSDTGHNATGAALGAFYSLSKRTTLYGLTETLSNDRNAGFRPIGSAGLSPNFTGSDVNGRRISGAQLGIVHRF